MRVELPAFGGGSWGLFQVQIQLLGAYFAHMQTVSLPPGWIFLSPEDVEAPGPQTRTLPKYGPPGSILARSMKRRSALRPDPSHVIDRAELLSRLGRITAVSSSDPGMLALSDESGTAAKFINQSTQI